MTSRPFAWSGPSIPGWKRATDITLCLILAPVVALAAPIIAAVIAAAMGRPVLFRQVRPGLNGEPFEMIKFRTMRQGRGGAVDSCTDADRLTPLGRFLRASSLDELPELWNVLRGDMSLVGPRPLLVAYLPLYSTEQMRRHSVRPGITGWAQVNGRNAIGWDEKFRLDVWYVDHQSLLLDLKILWLTAIKVFNRDGISAADHVTMSAFTGNDAPQD